MTEQRWKVLRVMQEIPMDVWFEYYKEMGGTSNNPAKFEIAFTYMIANDISVLNSKRVPVKLNFYSAVKRLINYYDDKYGITHESN